LAACADWAALGGQAAYGGDEPKWNDVERFGSSLSPTDAADEPIRTDVERFDSSPPPAGGHLRSVSEVGGIYLPADKPDVPENVLPYANVVCERQKPSIRPAIPGVASLRKSS
jgi:hypothetical protein